MALKLLWLAAAASAATTLTSNNCADASGLDSCLKKSNDQASSCIAQAKKDGSQIELLACSCQNYVNNFNCYSANCWNKVWGCQYQSYMVEYFANCATAKYPVPYFPAPDDAQAACSCNLGKVFNGVQNSLQQASKCSSSSQGSDPGSNLHGALSSIVEICPNTDPKLLGLSTVNNLEMTSNTNFQTCGKYLQTYDCQNDLGFKIDGVNKFLQPSDPLTTGTATTSDLAGTVTAPASGKVFSYTNGGDGVVYTITAAGKFKSGGKGDSGSGSSNGGDSNGGSSNDKGKGSKNAAGRLVVNEHFIAAVLIVWAVGFL